MGDPVPSSAISDATTGGLSVIVITGGSTGDVLTLQANGTYAPATVSAGDVVGPSSATDNAVARFDATTGNLLQNSVVTIGDTGNIAGLGTVSCGAITTTGVFTGANGSVSAPSLNLGDSGTGFYRPASGEICLATGGQNWISFFQAVAVNLKSNLKYGISSDSANARTAPDVTLARNATGPAWIIAANGGVQIRNLANSADGALTAAAITASGLICCGVYTFATVPSASSNTGKFLRISDRAQKHAYSDGTDWRFFGDDAVIS